MAEGQRDLLSNGGGGKCQRDASAIWRFMRGPQELPASVILLGTEGGQPCAQSVGEDQRNGGCGKKRDWEKGNQVQGKRSTGIDQGQYFRV